MLFTVEITFCQIDIFAIKHARINGTLVVNILAKLEINHWEIEKLKKKNFDLCGLSKNCQCFNG